MRAQPQTERNIAAATKNFAVCMRWAVGLMAVLFVGCAPQIGDSCTTSADCSVNGDRICDRAYPDGYCTVLACDSDTCPDGARCVEWRFMPDRTAATYCMAACEEDGDCRAGYACMEDSDARLLDDEGEPLARVIDSESSAAQRYCVAIASE